MKVITEMRRAH